MAFFVDHIRNIAVLFCDMHQKTAFIEIDGVAGRCGAREVFLGFAPANVLYVSSFADVLDEDTGAGYQRPRNRIHSLDFKRYISQPDSSTIPLTFNLRKEMKKDWSIIQTSNGHAKLKLRRGVPCLAQVDCQHRLGEMKEEETPLAFMAFLGLDLRSEMAMFTIINSKARGLSSSLTDYHRSNLIDDLATEAPELFIARCLNEDPKSPWFKMIRYGGQSTSGLKRKTSLRMMQKAIRRFLNQTRYLQTHEPANLQTLLLDYWHAVGKVFEDEWRNHRSNLITKGVGLYALTQLLGTIINKFKDQDFNETFFVDVLQPMKTQIDWGTHGTFSSAGGHKGATEAHETIKSLLRL